MPSDSPRIAELRRRVHADPASIAFAQLAEEYRRAGHYDEAIKYCRTGLARHPGYLSARVTLGRALCETGGLDEAAREFAVVLKSAPDNLAAIRGLAEIHQRRGDMPSALEYYKRALALARFDPDLEETVTRIGREMGSVNATSSDPGLSFEQARSELLTAAARMPQATIDPAPSENYSDLRHDAPSAPSAPSAHSAPDRPSAPDALSAPIAPSPPGDPAPRGADLIDFDALLASLGVPDASPPPVMQMLLSDASVQVHRPEPTVPELPAVAPVEEPFADLERELRALDAAPVGPSPEAAVADVVEQLESWMRVLDHERDGRPRWGDHSSNA